MQSESGHPGSSRPRLAFPGRGLVAVFGASEYVAPIRLRLFHTGGNRFAGVAYRIAQNPSGGELWTPDAFDEADLLQAAERIPRSASSTPGARPSWRSGTTIRRC